MELTAGCARNGAHVVLHHLGDSTLSDIHEVEAECHVAGARTVVVAGDISSAQTGTAVCLLPDFANPEQIVEAAVSTFSRLDVLISNAGICPFHAFLDLPHPLWHKVQDVNLNGAFYVTQAAANQMAKQEPGPSGQRGSIIAISSISALMGGGEQTHYTPTKAGLKSLMESCAIALGKYGIRCNSVLPGLFLISCLSCSSKGSSAEPPRDN